MAARLLKHVSAAKAIDGENLVFSPLSIHVALELMSTAAGGETLAQILDFVGAPSSEELAAFVRATVINRVLADRSGVDGPSVAFACSTWTDKRCPLDPAYVATVADTFKGGSSVGDFRDKPTESRKQINACVAKATRNHNHRGLGSQRRKHPNTVHVVANAIHFKGDWLTPFKEENTVDREFHLLDGVSTVEVPFLRNWGNQFIACHDGFKVLKLPYEIMKEEYEYGDYELYSSLPRFSMCIFLPGERGGVTDLVEKIASSPAGFLHSHLPDERVSVGQFRLPKFKLTFESDMVRDLKSLGLRLPFNPEDADMSDMLLGKGDDGAGEGLHVHRVIHKAVIEMNEEGSEAAAVTVESDDDMGFSLDGDYGMPKPMPVVNFVADHPFAFFIVEERSGAIVFVGHVCLTHLRACSVVLGMRRIR